MSNNAVVSKNLKVLRDKFGYSQDFIGQTLGVSHTIISRYESGESTIPSESLEKLALLYGIDEYDFYEESIDMQQATTALAFRADELEVEDLSVILEFKKIVRNYLNMKQAVQNE